MLIWRIAHDSLPHRVNLARRGIELDPICLVCNRLNEDGAHLFLKCKKIKRIWTDLQLDNVRDKLLKCQDAQDFVNQIIRLQREHKHKTISLIWWIWQARNKMVAGENKNLHGSISFLAMKMADEFEQFFTKEKRIKKQSAQSWFPPDDRILKINIDGSYVADNCNGGWGFIIRNSDGQFKGAGAGQISHAFDALQAEATACLASLQYAQRWGMMRIQVETDSQLLVQAINGRNQDLAVNGSLFREIKFLANLNFSTFEIKYCPRACNKVAHVLANYGVKLDQNNSVSWFQEAPDFVNILLASDFAVLEK